MIIDLTLENYKSFKESATVSFAAGTIAKLSGNLLKRQNGERFVKSMALFGPNASGKTTLLDGLYALHQFVLFSTQDQKPTAQVPRFDAFALDASYATRPARVSLTIELEGDRYLIDVAATRDQVWSETLKVQRATSQPNRKTASRILIQRTWEPEKGKFSVKLHNDLGTDLARRTAEEQTPKNRLVIGKLASIDNKMARRVVEWFDEDLHFYDMHRNSASEEAMLVESARLLKDNKAFAATVEQFMRDADTGIQSLSVVDEKAFEPHFDDSENRLMFKENVRPGLAFQHIAEDGSEVLFRKGRESSGTLRFLALLCAILQPSARPRLICIDELSASMHPDLVRRLIQLVHSGRHNKLGAQLLFTTHDTHLMNPSELLRQDQITICEKDRFGRSTAKRLDDFQGSARSDANLQKQYHQGRFGGKPEFGPTLEEVQVDDEPLEVGA